MEIIPTTKTFCEHFEDIAARRHDRIAVRLKTPEGYRQIRYCELYRQVQGVALALVSQGLERQERAAILSENRPEWVIAYLGTYLAGGTAVPIDPQISAEEWRRLLDDSEAKAVFVSGELLTRLKPVLHDSPLRDHIISLDPAPAGECAASLSELIDRGQATFPPPLLPAPSLPDVAVIIYTSGTTGHPKGVMLTHQNIMAEISAVLQTIDANQDDALLCLLPLHHVLASVLNFLLPLSLGAQVVFADTLKRSEILAALQEAGITILATVPQFFYLFHGRIQEELGRRGRLARLLFRGMLRANRFCRRRLRWNAGRLMFGNIHRAFGASMRLFASGGSAFDPKVAQEFHELGFTILQGYGLTETTGAATVTPVERNVIGSVGRALPGVEIKILDPDQHGVGEVAIRGPIVMKGYYHNPEATAEAIRSGWFLSGDLGWLDPEGNLYITGRKKEVIVLPNGKNIYPDELEAHFEQCPYIEEIAILGLADPGREGAERLHGVVVPDFAALKLNRIANAREILSYEIARLSHKLPQYKRLMSYQIQVEPLPRTTTRKIKRLDLKHQIESGQLKGIEDAGAPPALNPEDRELLESAVGQEVLTALRETYRRDREINLDMNLELDLGFDSMERVEFMASLEQSLAVKLPEGFSAEIFTVRDLIRGLQVEGQTGAANRGTQLQGWGSILSKEALEKDPTLRPQFAGPALTLLKYGGLRMIYLLFKALFRLEVAGLQNLPREGPFLLCPNHLSYIDPLIVLAPLPFRIVKRVFFVGASEFFVSLWMKALARATDIFPVDPDVHLLRAMKIGACGLRRGRILCIFPEGSRSFDGRLGTFRKGAAILAREIGVVTVPVVIGGAYEVWPRDSMRIRLHKLRVEFGEPIRPATGKNGTTYAEDTDRLRQTISRMIEAG
jgi:long-chain acyl-CoA synthetase